MADNKIGNKKLFSGRLRTVIVIVLVLVVGFFVYKKFFPGSAMTTYQTAAVEKATLVTTVSASGLVLSSNSVNVTTAASGLIKAVDVKDGDTVTVGQKIMEITLDPPGLVKSTQAAANLQSARNTIDSASASAFSLRSAKDSSWKKFYDLSTSSMYQNADGSARDDMRNSSAEFQSAQADWLAAEAKFKNQQAVISQAQTSLAASSLSYQQSAPIISASTAGVITNIKYVPGMIIAEQTSGSNGSSAAALKVAEIKNNGQPVVSVNLAEIDVAKVSLGQRVTVTVDALGGKTFTGKVLAVDNTGSVTSGVTTYTAAIVLDSGDDHMYPNMGATAKIITSVADNVLLVPSAAVQSAGGATTVRILKNGKLTSVPVEVGNSNDTQTEITSGLTEGEEIVTAVANPTTTRPTGTTTSPFGNTGNRGFGALGGGANRGR